MAWSVDAFYYVYAEWRGGKNCVWIPCKRTLNVDICMEIWQEKHLEKGTLIDNTVHSVTNNYNSSKPEKSRKRQIFYGFLGHERDASVPHTAKKQPSMYNLTGKIWIATVSRSFNFGNDIPVKKGR
jgi:hypothetical protein